MIEMEFFEPKGCVLEAAMEKLYKETYEKFKSARLKLKHNFVNDNKNISFAPRWLTSEEKEALNYMLYKARLAIKNAAEEALLGEYPIKNVYIPKKGKNSGSLFVSVNQ